jgi:hypothetical protein
MNDETTKINSFPLSEKQITLKPIEVDFSESETIELLLEIINVNEQIISHQKEILRLDVVNMKLRLRVAEIKGARK